MITTKDTASLHKMEQAGQRLVSIFDQLGSYIQPGMSTLQVNNYIETKLHEYDLVSQSKGYKGYRHVSCISINDQVVHGIPSEKTIIAQGDLVKVDVCAAWQGYCADMARCYAMGTLSEKIQKLVRVAQDSLDKGIAQARAGNHLSDISAAIGQEVEQHGFSVIRDFAGHGIGKRMHEEPEILNYGKPGKGPILRPGMTFAIEPMIVVGDYKVFIDYDGWTVKTVDHSWAAHVEDTIVVTDGEPKILTRRL